MGNFQRGGSGTDVVAVHPDCSQVVVVSRGQAYVVNPAARSAVTLRSNAITQLYRVDELRLLIFDQQGIRYEALGPDGIRWQTRRLSWDGFRGIVVAGATLSGEAWNAIDHAWNSFSVNLHTGAAEGGAYNRADATSGQKLYKPTSVS
ncbi:MAG: hypothetical protein HY049_16310 [Acidobacteria bacterium]|nr:hypothetical protein [Acidobacteriota bacterium]